MKYLRLLITSAVATFAWSCDASPPRGGEPAGAGVETAAAGETAASRLPAGGSAPAAAGADVRQAGGETAPSPPLIDPTIPPAIAGEGGWNYHQSASADLDGDGSPERVVLTARVEMYRGRPAWDDGQPWQVYVETAQGTRTYLYAQRLQLGTLTMRITSGSDGARPPSCSWSICRTG